MTEEFIVKDIRENKEISRKFIYDFDKMTIYQRIACKNYFIMQDLQKISLPETGSDVKIAAQRMSENRAYASLLIEVDANGDLLDYNPESPAAIALLKRVTDFEVHEKLEACKINFIMKMGITLNESAHQLAGLIQNLKKAGMSESEMSLLIGALVEKDLSIETNLNKTSMPSEETSSN